MTEYVIEQKMSNSGTIHDIASDQFDRVIRFPKGHEFAIVLSSYYGGKGYTTHKTNEAVVRKAKQVREFSYTIIDVEGKEYYINGDRLYRDNC